MAASSGDSARVIPVHEQRERLIFRADLRAYAERESTDEGSLDPVIDSIIRRHLASAESEIQERRPDLRIEVLTMPGQRFG